MTKAEVIERVRAIEAMKFDDEAAHVAEDKLYFDLLTAIAAEGDERAVEALRSEQIKFSRWCA